MDTDARTVRTAKRRLAKLVWVGLLVAAFLFASGCEPKSAALLEETAVRYAELNLRDDASSKTAAKDQALFWGPGAGGPEDMVRLASLESLGAIGTASAGALSTTAGISGPAGGSKWDTAMRDLRELPSVSWDNAKAVARRPMNLLILGTAGAASIAGEFTFDNHVDDELRGWKIINRDWTIAVGTAGNPGTHFGLAVALYAHGLITDNSQTYDFGKTLTQALALNGLATAGLKLAANNHGPNGEMWAWPSGHTSSTMTVASVVHEYYGLLPAAPLYTLTGLVMYERMITGEHWASDVIFGAALGYVVGHTVAGEHQMQIMGMEVIPYTDPYSGSSGIGLVKSW